MASKSWDSLYRNTTKREFAEIARNFAMLQSQDDPEQALEELYSERRIVRRYL